MVSDDKLLWPKQMLIFSFMSFMGTLMEAAASHFFMNTLRDFEFRAEKNFLALNLKSITFESLISPLNLTLKVLIIGIIMEQSPFSYLLHFIER